MPSQNDVAVAQPKQSSRRSRHHHHTASGAANKKSSTSKPQEHPSSSRGGDAPSSVPPPRATDGAYVDPCEPAVHEEHAGGPQNARAAEGPSAKGQASASKQETAHTTSTASSPSTLRRENTAAPQQSSPRSPLPSKDDMEAMVVNKGKVCSLVYSPAKDTFKITRLSSAGKTKTVLNIPVHMIINIETAAEREERQRARQDNDETIKLVFAESNGEAGLLCSFPSGLGADDGGDSLVFAHSRANTADGSTSGFYGSILNQGGLNSPSARSNQSISPLASAQTSIRYSVHYLRQRNRERPTIHSLEFASSGPAELVQSVVKAVLDRVYHRGPKHIIVFISPKSGKGKGEGSFDKHVRPVLHFSRHTYQTYLTQRAHDLEDYVANIDNPINRNTVVVAVGGDGMINETVNGVHRRKLALVRWLRTVTTDVPSDNLCDDASTEMLPNFSHHMDGDDGSSSAGGLDPQALTTTASDAASTTALPTKAPNTPGPLGPGYAGAPFIQHGQEENKRNGNASPAYTTAVEARKLARRVVEEGWDAVMPLVATVPTGSACGLAKSLSVLSMAESALALVHLSSVRTDLLHMRFTPNPAMVEHHRNTFSAAKLASAKQAFADYTQANKEELQERAQVREDQQETMHILTTADAASPFLKNGGNVYKDPVSCALKIPSFDSRVAFMSLSFGAANDIDYNSEPLRWMGNARFHVYGGYMLLMGLRRHNGVLRYLPWMSKAGKTMEKLHLRDTMPSSADFPICTMKEDCPHCREYAFTHCGASSEASSGHATDVRTDGNPITSCSGAGAGESRPPGVSSAAATLAPFTDAQLLDEESVDFDDGSLPWVTIRGEFCIALICNVRDVSQDMLMAPLAHMSDGAIDVVYCRIDPCTGRGGRLEMLQFFMGLESGKHVDLDFVNYVKARALEIKVDSGLSMSDGELMPLSSVRMTKLRGGVQLVRNE